MKKEKTSSMTLGSLLSSWQDFRGGSCGISSAGDQDFPIQVHGLKGSLFSFFLKDFADQERNRILHEQQYGGTYAQFQKDYYIVTSTQKEADETETDLRTAFNDSVEIFQLPWWGSIPYRAVAKKSAVFGKRAAFFAKILQKNKTGSKPRFFIIPQRSLSTPVPPPSYIKDQVFVLRKGQTADMGQIARNLASQGFLRVSKVGMKGEFTLRGEVLDIFLWGEENPCRIQFDFDTIEQIKVFDVETQSTRGNLEKIVIYPMKEVVWNEDLVLKLDALFDQTEKYGIKNNYAEYDRKRRAGLDTSPQDEDQNSFDDRSKLETAGKVILSFTDQAKKAKNRFLNELSLKYEAEGEEFYYGHLWDRTYTVADYFAPESEVFFRDYDRLLNAKKLLENEYAVSYRTARQEFPVFPPETMLLDFEDVTSAVKRKVAFRSLDTSEDFNQTFSKSLEIKSEPSQSFFGNINLLKEQLREKQDDGWHIYVYADNGTQALRISELLKEFTEVTDITKFPLEILPSSITGGFSISEEKILVIQENEIFGRKRNSPHSVRKAKSKVIDTFVELNPGDFVVHVNFGIGLFKCIERLSSMGTERDFIKILFDEDEILYVPIEQVNLVQKYIGSEGSKPKLDKLGGKAWNARKAKVQKKVEEIAEKLIDLYSKRKASRGFPFPKDDSMMVAFEAAFPYEDTEDQATATSEIKADMESPLPMDRLVCGDVGYGKTEIAMRAAMKAVLGGKQVAFLAPTTILAEQHYENCIERFRNFPVRIGQLSRFISPAEQKKTIAALKEGKIDILVGTHRIIQKDVVFKDLGLMIIDEEQRFGVKDKEKLKTLKTNIDSLAMSATPIPRTLHMSLLKIRDMSLLTTPPHNRQPVETAVEEYNDGKIAAAIRKEVERGGQVFYLHNRVETLYEIRHRLENLLPEMLIETAHGQMTSDELDDIFRRFKSGGFHILVATTIIENGIDIPNVNTIIIDRADMYGVSQLYQLRGRVGRSDRKAYAYLFYPENRVLSEVALRRLQVISDFTELGSGFKIAMKDMEIRGAGNLLGKDQSGEVCAVGFEMYMNLMNNAIERLYNSDWHDPGEILLDLQYSGFIPDRYVKDAETKMEMYKKIASIMNEGDLDAVWAELEDRFGPVPDEVSSLLGISRIRIICNKLSITSLKEKKGEVTVEFGSMNKISPEKIIRLIEANPKKIRLNPVSPNQIILACSSVGLTEKSEFIVEKLEQIL